MKILTKKALEFVYVCREMDWVCKDRQCYVLTDLKRRSASTVIKSFGVTYSGFSENIAKIYFKLGIPILYRIYFRFIFEL